jgi:hypothetical protein
MAIDQNLIAASRKRIDHEVTSLPGILEEVYAKGDYRRVGFNVDLISAGEFLSFPAGTLLVPGIIDPQNGL